MDLKRSSSHDAGVEFPEPAPKRRRSEGRSLGHINISIDDPIPREGAHGVTEEYCVHSPQDSKDKSVKIASDAQSATQTVAPFLTRHIPNQYAPLGGVNGIQKEPPKDPNSKFCYRHRPDLLCRRQADEPSMDQMQKDLESLPEKDRQGIAHVWSLFSAAPSKHRNLMLQGILAQCCFPQLSYLSGRVKSLLKIDFLAALPPEISFRILCFLDSTSLCKAAQVSQKWRQLADDDVVWHRMCEQHIDRKCTRCGWGLPAMEQKLLRASKRQIQLKAAGLGINAWSPNMLPRREPVEEMATHGNQPQIGVSQQQKLPESSRNSPPPLLSVDNGFDQLPASSHSGTARHWKNVYKESYKVGTNWKYGRCSTKIFRGHTNGVVCLQFTDDVLATGSYDATIKIWSIETGKEVRTLTAHTQGIRCLQFDDSKLISGSLDGTLKIWNWRTGECLSTYRGHGGGVIGLHFDGDLLVSGSVDRTIRMWNFRDKSLFTLRGHTDWVNAVKIHAPSRTIFSASDDLTIRLWDIDTRKCLSIFRGHVGQVQQIVLLPRDFDFDERQEEVSTHGTATPDSLAEEPGPASIEYIPLVVDSRYHETFDADPDRPTPPRYFLTGALDSTIRLWEVPTGKCVKTFFGHVEGVWALAADTIRFVSGAEDRMVKVWDSRTGACEKTYTGHAGPVTCVDHSDSRMCSGSEDGEVRMHCFKSEVRAA